MSDVRDDRADFLTATENSQFDVIVVGGGNAGYSAAHAAAEDGATVILLEKGPVGHGGGNSFYTAGATRVPFDDLSDLVPLFDDEITAARLDRSDVPTYPKSAFYADMERMTEGRNDPRLTEILVENAFDAVQWLASKGIRYRLQYERQSYEVDGQWTFFGNLPLGTVDGGKGLIEQHHQAAAAAGVVFRFDAGVTGLLRDADGAVIGVEYTTGAGERHEVHGRNVVLAAGGFESDPARRAKYLGEEWGRALVRGNPLNTGEVLDIALAAGAQPFGDWTSCHSVAWDAGGPPNGGDRVLTNQMTRQSYPLGIVVNKEGKRFVDEGADFRNYTYAKYGAEILKQTDGMAVQVFDAELRPMLRSEEYDSSPITMAQADTLDELAEKLGLDPAGFVATVEEFNASIEDKPFHPSIKDGRAARVVPPKSNWANPIATAPFYGYVVSCGITFTFGGLKIDSDARALDASDEPIPGLYVAGEMVGGLFSVNYPGGSGLTSGTVFGRLAGRHAAARAGALTGSTRR
jgi:tricarballylate dehydrogenase